MTDDVWSFAAFLMRRNILALKMCANEKILLVLILLISELGNWITSNQLIYTISLFKQLENFT